MSLKRGVPESEPGVSQKPAVAKPSIQNPQSSLAGLSKPTLDKLARLNISSKFDLVLHLPQGYDTPIGENGAVLSGGQRQRVALARALINQPQVLLLDEPLGALDLKLREQMQTELKALQRRLGITFLFITHDQHEALSMSDRIGVFNRGRLEQVGTPQAIYNAPATRFVADFVGAANVFSGDRARQLAGVDSVMLRPERIHLGAPASARLSGPVLDVQYFGAFSRLRMDWAGEPVVVDLNPLQHAAMPGAGDTVHLHWSGDAVHALQGAAA